MKKITFIIIGLCGNLRSKPLDGFLGSGIEHHIVSPVLYHNQKHRGQLATLSQQKLMLGRELSFAEVGCALAHRDAVLKAQNLFREDECLEWVVIAEDDADLSEEIGRKVSKYLGTWLTQTPSLVNLYSPDRIRNSSVRNNNRPHKKQVILRPGTVCYAINRAGLGRLELFSRSPVNFVADWPLFFTDLKFFFTTQISVSEVAGPSTIGDRRNPGVMPRLLMVGKQLIHLPYLKRIHSTSLTSTLIWIVSPIFRDVYRRVLGAFAGKPMERKL